MVHYAEPGKKPKWGYFPSEGHPEAITKFEGTKATPEFLQAIAYEVYVKNVTFSVLSLKEKFPDISFVHSIHDYAILCPTVKLWTYTNENCLKSSHKFECAKCVKYHRLVNVKHHKRQRPVATTNRPIPNVGKRAYFIQHLIRRFRLITGLYNHDNSPFRLFRYHYIDMVNRYSDMELCVSRRVAEIVGNEGVNKNKLYVNYIGTKVAESCMNRCRTDINTEIFTILFMGYASESKGFQSLLDMFEDIKDNATNITIKLASRIDKPLWRNRINALRQYYHDIIIYDGYTHDDFQAIMQDVNLGVVPPVWEDNLPQVTMEMIANGIPVLTSNNGGAHELNTHPVFCFRDRADFAAKVLEVFNNRSLLSDYWLHSVPLITMEKHVEQLINLYSELKK